MCDCRKGLYLNLCEVRADNEPEGRKTVGSGPEVRKRVLSSSDRTPTRPISQKKLKGISPSTPDMSLPPRQSKIPIYYKDFELKSSSGNIASASRVTPHVTKVNIIPTLTPVVTMSATQVAAQTITKGTQTVRAKTDIRYTQTPKYMLPRAPMPPHSLQTPRMATGASFDITVTSTRIKPVVQKQGKYALVSSYHKLGILIVSKLLFRGVYY